MPTIYVRKPGSRRDQWTVENLKEAVKRIERGDMGVNEASRYYKVPAKTIVRRRQINNFDKMPLGPQGLLGRDNEKRLFVHIQRLQEAGFAPDRTTIRSTAFKFAESLGLQHKFNAETRLAGYDWLTSFLKRNKGLTVARVTNKNKEEVVNFFKLLTKIYDELDLYTKPGNIFHVGDSGCQLNNNPGESISVIACCSAEGVFLPPSLVIKGGRGVAEMEIGLPLGSKVYWNQKSSEISSKIFYQWMVEHFTPRKPVGKVLLLMDGHATHQSSLEMFEFAAANDIILLCLPTQTTQALQPLNRSFFKPFMTSYKEETQGWVNYHKKQIKRVDAGVLVGNAWAKSSTFDNAVNGFGATGIFPLNGTVHLDFNVSSTSSSTSDVTGTSRTEHLANHVTRIIKSSVDIASSQLDAVDKAESQPLIQRIKFESTENTPHNASSSKYLPTVTPAPKLVQQGKRQRRQSARIRDEELVHEKKHNLKRKSMKGENRIETTRKSMKGENRIETTRKSMKGENRIETTRKSMKKEKIQGECESEEDDLPVNLLELILLEEEDCCLECLLNYSKTDLSVDWLKCIDCGEWMHKACTMYGDRCNICGRREKLMRLHRIKK